MNYLLHIQSSILSKIMSNPADTASENIIDLVPLTTEYGLESGELDPNYNPENSHTMLVNTEGIEKGIPLNDDEEEEQDSPFDRVTSPQQQEEEEFYEEEVIEAFDIKWIEQLLPYKSFKNANETWKRILREKRSMTPENIDFLNEQFHRVLQSEYSAKTEFHIKNLSDLFMVEESPRILNKKYFCFIEEDPVDRTSITVTFKDCVKISDGQEASQFKKFQEVFFTKFFIPHMITNVEDVSLSISLSLHDSQFHTWKSECIIPYEFNTEMPTMCLQDEDEVRIKGPIRDMSKLICSDAEMLYKDDFCLPREELWGLFLTRGCENLFEKYAHPCPIKDEDSVLVEKNIHTRIWLETIHKAMIINEKKKWVNKILDIKKNSDMSHCKIKTGDLKELEGMTRPYLKADNMATMTMEIRTFNGKKFSEVVKKGEKLEIYMECVMDFVDFTEEEDEIQSPVPETRNPALEMYDTFESDIYQSDIKKQ